jgi:hypothetical protein
LNARFCWATLRGGKNRTWLTAASRLDPDFTCGSLEDWMVVRRKWLLDSNETTMIVRFVSNDDTDGHSVVSYKYEDQVMTFQAYFEVCNLTVLPYDIFDGDNNLIVKMQNKELVNASDFGLPISTQSVIYKVDLCKYLKE